MSYFNHRLNTPEQVQAQLSALHRALYPQMTVQNLALVLHTTPDRIGGTQSVTMRGPHQAYALQYSRNKAEARHIERLMGLAVSPAQHMVDVFRHPVIEMRVTADNCVLELVIPPTAWWDQQNFVGKLSIPRHRDAFYDMLRKLGPQYRQGFWHGLHLSDMHIVATINHNHRILTEWFNTFAPRQDYFRLGVWYDLDDPALTTEAIHEELLKHIKTLYSFYAFILWTSDNNYREFAAQNSG